MATSTYDAWSVPLIHPPFFGYPIYRPLLLYPAERKARALD